MQIRNQRSLRIAGLVTVLGISLPGLPEAGQGAGSTLETSTRQSVRKVSGELVEAVKSQSYDRLRVLLEETVDVDDVQGDGTTALHWAVHRNDLQALDLLLEAGADVNAANTLGATPIWLASINGDRSVVSRLLKGGANPNTSLLMGETPLMSAARSGGIDTVNLLLRWGADVDLAEYERGQTALMWAAAQGHVDVVLALVAGGADLHARTRVWYQLENTAGNTNPIGNFRMAHGGSTALLFAARNGDVATARSLIEAGANVDDVSASGTSALVISAHSGHESLALYLVNQGADPNADLAGYTALHAAVLRGQSPLVRALLANGADIEAVVQKGTPGRRFSADFSIRHQAVGANAFWLAAKYGELGILEMLLQGGADPFVMPVSGVSSLQAAMGRSAIPQENRRNRVGVPRPDRGLHEDLVLRLAEVVLDLGVDVNAVDQRGDTALHDAVRNGWESVVKLLAVRGADLGARNERDQTALALAETLQPVPGTNGLRTTRPKIAEILRGFGAEN